MTVVEVAAAATAPGADSALLHMWSGRVRPVGFVPFVARAPREAAQDLVDAAVRPGRTRGEHLHLANAYSIALADQEERLGATFSDANGWNLPDGKPVMWVSALRGDEDRLHQVRGPQFMLDVADLGRGSGLKHYLLGGSQQTLELLVENLEDLYPGIEIVGSFSPPFRTPSDDELVERDAAIAASGAQVVWVGLGTPKQDYEALRLAESLPVVAVAVGAAFDFAAGTLKPAPEWVGAIGFEWLWRMLSEPRRLWRRYTFGSARFVAAVVESEWERRRRSRSSRTAARGSTAVVVGQLPPPLHGSAIMTQRLAETLEDQGRPVRVVDRRFSRSADEVGSFSLRKVLAAPSLLVRFMTATIGTGPIVLLVTTTPFAFLLDVAMVALARRSVTLYIHTTGFRALADRGPIWHALVQHVLGAAGRIVVLGDTLADDVAPFVDRDRVTVVANTVPDAPDRRHTAGTRVLFLSNLLPGKGADAFVRLATRAAEAHADWAFDLAGAGDAAALGPVPASLTIHGRVQGERKLALLDAADLLVVPSTYALEAQPLVILEAMSHGVPVVAYDNGGIRDVVDDAVGALVPSADESALFDAVEQLLDDPDRLAAARRAARARYLDRYSPGVYAGAWQQLLADDATARTAVPARAYSFEAVR